MKRASALFGMIAVVLLAPGRAGATTGKTQYTAAYDVIGSLGMPVVSIGMLQIGHAIDTRNGDVADGVQSVGFDKFFFVLSLGMDFVGLKYLGDGLNVPTTWASTGAGFGLGAAVGLGLLGIDAAFIAGLHLSEGSPGIAILSAITVFGWSVATSLLISTDPFHLAHPAATKGTVSTPLFALPF